MDEMEAASRLGFLRVAAATPRVFLGNIDRTVDNIIIQARRLEREGARLIVFPELCLAGGYTNADLFFQDAVINGSLDALRELCEESQTINAVLIVGLPLLIDGRLYNVAAVIDRGRIAGIVPKTYLPTYKEFYEARWFTSAKKLRQKRVKLSRIKKEKVKLFDRWIPIGTDLLFQSNQAPEIKFGVEICEDAWVPVSPSRIGAMAGAVIYCNLSASNDIVGKAKYRRQLVESLSAQCNFAYIYSCAGAGESSTDLVFRGHDMVAVNGVMIAESERSAMREKEILADINIALCLAERMRNNSFADCNSCQGPEIEFRTIRVDLAMSVPRTLMMPNPRHPFIPESESEQEEVCTEVLSAQAEGLAKRLSSIRIAGKPAGMVLGLSGGLDSAHVALVCLEAAKLLGCGPEMVRCYTMPSECTTAGTRSNAIALAQAAGISIEEIPIGPLVKQLLADSGHDGITQDVAYENAQARERMIILFQKANMLNSIVVGTGNVSENANGFCTAPGDHSAHYNPNSGLPKTLLRFMVGWYAANRADPELAKILQKILGTPISPELTKPNGGQIAQITEEIVGPYELLDFYMYHFIRYGSSAEKILYLASQAYGDSYSIDELAKWLKKFTVRFFANQHKRSTNPDGPKVGSVALSPRGDWRMPSDVSSAQWLKGLDEFAAWLKLYYAN